MNRRKFFSQSAATVLSSKDLVPAVEEKPIDSPENNPFMNKTIPQVPRTLAGIEQYSGPWGYDQVIHLLRRTTFGATKAHIDALLQKDVSAAVDMLLTTVPVPNPPVAPVDEQYPRTNPTEFGVKAGQTWVNEVYNNNFEGQRTPSLQSWWIGLILAQDISITEKMTLFWHNHFVSEAVEVQDSRFMYKQNALLRQSALGNFKTLAREITLDPAMLRYLNGNTNTKQSPNENYGRELQELFTIGKGPEIAPGNYTNYTEDDVKAAAKVLTGWRDNRNTIGITFNASQHDTADKKFSSAYGNTVIKGQTTEAGARKELDDLLDMIFAQQETARYIVRKFYRWFVYYVIDAATEQNVIEPLATMLKNNNYEVKPVLAALFKSAHFYDPINTGCVIKSPIDLLVGTGRTCNVKFPDATQLDQQYSAWKYVYQAASIMQQLILGPPNVAGWPAYWQEPVYYEIWITSDTLPKRNAATDTIATGKDPQGRKSSVTIDVIELVKLSSNPTDPNVVVNDLAQLFYPIGISTTQKDEIKSNIVSSNQDYEWTNNWDKYIKNQMTQTEKTDFITKIQNMVKYMMNLAEYQLS